jgi:hypothetical protein
VKDIPQGGWKFSAGVHLSVGKKGHEIEGGAAPVARAAPKGCLASLVEDQVEEVVLQAHYRVLF